MLTLASSSPYRKAILERLGLDFDCVSPDIDESGLPGETARQLVERLARLKASKVAESRQSGLVIGSDQVCEQNGEIIGKPADHAHAVRQLKAASGQISTLFTGVALINAATGRIQSDVATVEVRCRELSDNEIERYLIADQPYNCCGSLKVESLGISLLSGIKSDDPNTITGLPVIRLLDMLRKEGINVP